MKATHALAELDKLGSAQDPVFYHPFREGDVSVETPVNEIVHSPGMGDKDAREIRLDYWGHDRYGMFRLIRNGTLSGMLSERRRDTRAKRAFQKATEKALHQLAQAKGKPAACPLCHRPY